MSQRLVIKLPLGYILGFNERHRAMEVTQDKCSAISFADIEEVEDFVNEYADAGYGFKSDNYILEDI